MIGLIVMTSNPNRKVLFERLCGEDSIFICEDFAEKEDFIFIGEDFAEKGRKGRTFLHGITQIFKKFLRIVSRRGLCGLNNKLY